MTTHIKTPDTVLLVARGGAQIDPLTIVPEDFVEVTIDEWTDWNLGEGEGECDSCEATIGAHSHCSDPSQPERDAWKPCFMVGESVVCEDCRHWLIEEAEEAEADFLAGFAEEGP